MLKSSTEKTRTRAPTGTKLRNLMSLMTMEFSELMMSSKMKMVKWSSKMKEDRREAREEVLVSLERRVTDPRDRDQRKPPEEPRNSLKSLKTKKLSQLSIEMRMMRMKRKKEHQRAKSPTECKTLLSNF